MHLDAGMDNWKPGYSYPELSDARRMFGAGHVHGGSHARRPWTELLAPGRRRRRQRDSLAVTVEPHQVPVTKTVTLHGDGYDTAVIVRPDGGMSLWQFVPWHGLDADRDGIIVLTPQAAAQLAVFTARLLGP